jgi:hypothetical protein
MHDRMLADPHFFRDKRWLIYEDTVFANYYFDMLHRVDRGKPIPEAWQIAIDHARSGDDNAAQDMLMGINAHVQRDMPYVVATVGMVTPKGQSRKPDHDVVNKVLNDAYQPVIDAIHDRYDPILSLTNADWSPIDDIAGLEAVKGWREGVWRNAERLLNAKTADERQQVIDQIETNAAVWAHAIGDGEVQPGYRLQRDAYCHRQLGR